MDFLWYGVSGIRLSYLFSKIHRTGELKLRSYFTSSKLFEGFRPLPHFEIKYQVVAVVINLQYTNFRNRYHSAHLDFLSSLCGVVKAYVFERIMESASQPAMAVILTGHIL